MQSALSLVVFVCSMNCRMLCFFFFSSRRRHTRCSRDWSSDVCSSDLALLLAMIGLYGALGYLVTMRRAEFGVRMALGARPASILSLVMKDVAVVLGSGVTAGAFTSLLTVGFLQKMLFGLTARDPLTMVAAIGLLSAAGFLAGYLPARRAMRVDPMAALRYE